MRLTERTVILATGAHNKLPNTAHRISIAIGILRSEPFVIVVVAVNDHIGIGIVQRLKERLDFQVIAMLSARAEQRLVKVRKGASLRMTGQIGAQPFLFTRRCVASADFDALAVQRDNVPGTKVVAVEAILWLAGCLAKIIEIVGGVF